MIECVLRTTLDRVEQRPARMISQAPLLLAVAVVVGVALAEPAAAQVAGGSAVVAPNTFTSKRIAASSAAVAGLIATVIGGLAVARSAGREGTGSGRRGAIVALVLGPISLVAGVLVVATAQGGLGTGNGIAGGVIAMIVGLIGMTLGVLALSRSRRTASHDGV